MFIRKSNDVQIVDCELSADGRFTSVDCILGQSITRVIFLYTPNNSAERKEFFRGVRSLLDTPAKVILGGNFNCVLRRQDRTPASAV